MWKWLSQRFGAALFAGMVAVSLSGCGMVTVGTIGHHSIRGIYTPDSAIRSSLRFLSGTVTGEADTVVANATPATLTLNNEITDESDFDCGLLGIILDCTASITEAEWSASFGKADTDLHVYGYPVVDPSEADTHEHSVILHVTTCTYSDLTPCNAIINGDAKWGYVAKR